MKKAIMNPTIKARWVKALRSGRYKQAQGVLETPDGRNCCLGVLCRILRIKRIKTPNAVFFTCNGDTFEGYPSMRAMAAKGDLDSHHFLTSLADANDHGSSFEEIADRIEESSF